MSYISNHGGCSVHQSPHFPYIVSDAHSDKMTTEGSDLCCSFSIDVRGDLVILPDHPQARHRQTLVIFFLFYAELPS